MTWLNAPLKRNTRRFLSVSAALLLVLSYFLGSLDEQLYEDLGFLPLIPFFFVLVWLSKSTANIAGSSDKKLDERQRALRDRAYRLTYIVFLLYAVFMVTAESFGFGDIRVIFSANNQSIIQLLLTLNVFLLSALPILYVAWLEPDPPADESETAVLADTRTQKLDQS